MEIRILGSAGAEFPDARSTGILVDKTMLLDGGTIGTVLNEHEQRAIRHILVTHSHLDHVKAIPLLADNLIINGGGPGFRLYGLPETIAAIRTHLMNGILWPDFAAIPSTDAPIVSYCPVEPGIPLTVGPSLVTPFAVNHAVPAVGYRIDAGGKSLFFSGDMGPSHNLWQQVGPVDVLIIEVSFPNDMEELALVSGHLTPSLLEKELCQLPSLPGQILVTHMKPQFRDSIVSQVSTITPGVMVLADGRNYLF